MFSKASRFITARWVLLLVLLAYIIFKIPHLSYPYYWDESWPYAPAIHQMYVHGVSLMPGAVEPELSRGHPLFFHAAAATWMHLFGASHVAMHSFALCIALLFLVAVYETGLRFFNRNVAVLSLLLVSTQEVFFVQSSFVLFEVLVAFLAFLSLALYSGRRYFWAGLCLSALFYTKESGLIAGAVIGIDALAGLFHKSAPLAERLKKIAAAGVPVVLIGLFFLLQKHVPGWYIFPFYSGLVEHDWGAFWYKFRMSCIKLVFYDNLKFYIYLMLMFLTLIATIKSKKYRLLVLWLPAIIVFYWVDDMRAGRLLPSVPFFIVFIGAVVWFLYNYGSRYFFPDAEQRRFLILSGAFVYCFLCFSTMNFFTYRYLMAALVPMFFIAAVLFDLMIANTYQWVLYPVVCGILVTAFFSFRNNTGYGDADLGAFDGMQVHEQVVRYMEQIDAYDKPIATSSFLEAQHLINPETGFLKSGRTFKAVGYDITPTTEYVIMDNLEPDSRHDNIKNDTGFVLAYKAERPRIWAEVYKRKNVAQR